LLKEENCYPHHHNCHHVVAPTIVAIAMAIFTQTILVKQKPKKVNNEQHENDEGDNEQQEDREENEQHNGHKSST